MSTNTKRELLLRLRRQYAAADRQRKSKLLDSLIEATGYNRKYAISLLSKPPKPQRPQRRSRTSKYDEQVIAGVLQLWQAANGICAKRLKPFFPTLIETLERFGHLKLDAPVKEKILTMSLSTLERILKQERDKQPKSKSLTRPGSMLKKQVAVKTFSRWNDEQVGFFEVDLVAHCGGDISGKFINTLTMTDIATGWTEIAPLRSGASSEVRAGMERILELLPFKLKGIDCDNGREFLNHEMVAWCKTRRITFTRSRAYRKNDQAHVEEKNGSVVRRLVGYHRYEGPHAMEIISHLYSVSRLYINYFQPSMKLVAKTRIGAKVSKRYDTAKTPFERLVDSNALSKRKTTELHQQFLTLDPVALLAEMALLQSRLWQLSPPVGEQMACEDGPIEIPRKSRPEQAVSVRSIPQRGTRERKPPSTSDRGGNAARGSRIEFTEAFVNNAAVPASRAQQFLFRDSKLIGFGLRVTQGSNAFSSRLG